MNKQEKLNLITDFKPKRKKYIFSFSVLLLLVNVTLTGIERPQLLQRGFDRDTIVKNIGIFIFHLYDVFQQTRSQAQPAFSDGTELYNNINNLKNEIDDE